MTATILRPQLRQALLRQLHNNPKRKRNILQQGFTLVELMIVIVIVGILSATALPNFLNQTKKARLTEAKSIISAGLKNAQQQYLEGATIPATNTCTAIAVPEGIQNNWDYTCTPTAATGTAPATMKISAVGSGPIDGVSSGDWILTYTTGTVTEGTPTGL